MGNLGFIEILIILIGLAMSGLWIWALIDCATNDPSGTEKIVWILIILLGGCIGATIYLLVRRPKRMRDTAR